MVGRWRLCLTIASCNDQTYQRARLAAEGDMTLSADGDITFAGAMDTHTESHEKSKSNWAWQSAKGKGTTDQTLRQSELVSQGQLAIQAANRVAIEVPEIDAQSVRQTVDAMVAADPELAWLKQAEAQGDIDWRTVKEIHDGWDYSQSGLGKGAAIAISIAAAAVVGPMAAGVAGGIGTLGGAMAAGAAGSLAGTAAVSVINNRGNLGDTFDDTLSSDSLKGAALAAATAAASGWLDDAMNTSSNSVIDKTALDGVFKFVGRRAAQAGTDAALETAIQGGSFSDAVTHNLEGALATAFQAELFNQVGNLGMKLDLAESGPTKVALHALAGGLAAEATGSDFRSGAIAAGANEALVTQLAALVGNDPTLLVSASKITGILAAGMAGGDVEKGAEVAGNATAYNYLMHPEARRLQAINRLLEDDDTLTEAQRQSLEDERLEINIRSQSRDRALEQACGQGGSVSVCHYERAQLQVAMESWKGVPLGRDEQDTVLAEYIHTAGQYGQNQQQRVERIGAEALSEMAVDAASAPFILGSLVGQALLGDEESRATLQSVGEEIKALASDPANYISESNREQLARADALEQAGRLDDADKLRVRVALDNETMLMGTGGLLARLPRLARNVVTRSGMAGAGGISGGGKQDGVVVSKRTTQIAGARFNEIISSVNGKVINNYSILDNGPLSASARIRAEINDSLAATFSGGKYADIELADDLVVYRAWHPDQAREFGAFWSLEKPEGSLQTRIDSALLPEWGSSRSNPVQRQQATQYTEAVVPKGTRIYIGEVGSQGSPWVGSGSQLLIKDGTVLPEWKTGGGLLE